MADEDEYPVLTQLRGALNYAKIAEIRNDKYARAARLAEPFGSRMGWFNYSDLLKRGRAESQGFTVYTRDFWQRARRVVEGRNRTRLDVAIVHTGRAR
jgi:hypothetical protein